MIGWSPASLLAVVFIKRVWRRGLRRVTSMELFKVWWCWKRNSCSPSGEAQWLHSGPLKFSGEFSEASLVLYVEGNHRTSVPPVCKPRHLHCFVVQ
ncbi:hypothetical protein AGOR_G00006770 [Albula goreensis]|uniref:Uncharacterized protein n=1 Tax=Albula goreensis TaxID=1534307 RepID=A0A8T3EBD9_9TELE|nr:hypothetical protein AGOR_G00006770 [Albula goreensis]